MNSTIIFDSENPKYKCFFGKVHVTTATKFICWFEFAIGLLYMVWVLFQDIFEDSKFLLSFIFVCISLFVNAVIFLIPIYAVKKEKPKLLIPYLVLSIICSLLDGYCIGYDLISNNYENAWIIFDIVSFAINAWIIVVAYYCYRYLISKKQSHSLPMYFSNKNIETASIIREESTVFDL